MKVRAVLIGIVTSVVQTELNSRYFGINLEMLYRDKWMNSHDVFVICSFYALCVKHK